MTSCISLVQLIIMCLKNMCQSEEIYDTCELSLHLLMNSQLDNKKDIWLMVKCFHCRMLPVMRKLGNYQDITVQGLKDLWDSCI